MVCFGLVWGVALGIGVGFFGNWLRVSLGLVYFGVSLRWVRGGEDQKLNTAKPSCKDTYTDLFEWSL